MKKRTKLRYLGFIIGSILLVGGWIVRGIAFFLFEGTFKEYVMNKIGFIMSTTSVFFLLGGILFYAFIVSKEEPEEKLEDLTEEQQKEKIKQELENASYEIKSSVGFTIVYGFMSILTTLLSLCTIFINKLVSLWSVSSLLAGIFLSQYYIRKVFRQFKWLKEYKKKYKI
ncbi:hypothetical protein [Fusobacterium sp.]|uniref:hypothetical protein n=1 Tax=Fusobacterium sp. TaxID=68766 RepID=UPI00290058C2|nr:hypothetical protein [Fusobacterium sp.]MDU1911695.1 hypothetical protein [Fusobacterium sp.]